MKTRFAIVAILGLIASSQAWGQSRIESAVSAAEDRYSASKDEYSMTNKSRVTIDKTGKRNNRETRLVTFTPKDGDAALEKILSAFDADKDGAYYVNQSEGKGRDLIEIGDVVIGSDYDSYYVLCFEDKKDASMRKAYALEWNQNGSAFRFMSDYGPRPQALRYGRLKNIDLSSIADDMNSFADSITREINKIDWKAFADSISMKYEDFDWDAYSDSISVAIDSVTAAFRNFDRQPKRCYRFYFDGPMRKEPDGHMGESEHMGFGQHMGSGQHSGSGRQKGQAISSDRESSWSSRLYRQIDRAGRADDATAYVSEIYSLCRNCPDSIVKEDRKKAADKIAELRSSMKDKMLRKLLSASIKALK